MDDIRLTPTSFIVIGTINSVGSATPYDLKRFAGMGLNRLWSIQHSQTYSECTRLAKAGYLDEVQEETGRRRKIYTVTEKGREAFENWLADPVEQIRELRDLGYLKLFLGAKSQPLADSQIAAHEQLLNEYETLYKLVGENIDHTNDEGRRWVLLIEAGVEHIKVNVEFWKRVAAADLK